MIYARKVSWLQSRVYTAAIAPSFVHKALSSDPLKTNPVYLTHSSSAFTFCAMVGSVCSSIDVFWLGSRLGMVALLWLSKIQIGLGDAAKRIGHDKHGLGAPRALGAAMTTFTTKAVGGRLMVFDCFCITADGGRAST